MIEVFLDSGLCVLCVFFVVVGSVCLYLRINWDCVILWF